MVSIDPPGSICLYEAALKEVKKRGGQRFFEVGCGAGRFSELLCQKGLVGTGLDFSEASLEAAQARLAPYIAKNSYRLVQGDIRDHAPEQGSADFSCSLMVMEHVEDDAAFLQSLKKQVRPGGFVMVAVPGRMDLWSFEDETVGHHRRYERDDLVRKMQEVGLRDIKVLAIAVPVSNILFKLGDFLTRRRGSERAKKNLDKDTQSAQSGTREIPWKTVFPKWVGLILNRYTMMPFLLLQKCFYKSNLGTTYLGIGEVQP